jgi:arsenate reductase-like glutaredoxin family protein
MTLETIVITSKNCSSCQAVKDLVTNKNVRIVDVESPEGEALLQKFSQDGITISAVPDCIVLKDGKARRCTDQEQDDLLK